MQHQRQYKLIYFMTSVELGFSTECKNALQIQRNSLLITLAKILHN